MSHTGIPTTYNGVRFRSRTEARWAAMFGRLGWRWAYEPLDLDGYIPDFILDFDDGPLLVEVKAAVTVKELSEAWTKLEHSGWEHEALLVGGTLWEQGTAQPVIGWLGERDPVAGDLEWFWNAARAFYCLSCGRVSVLSDAGSWRCRQCGETEGHTGECGEALAEAWAESGNRVQWRGAA